MHAIRRRASSSYTLRRRSAKLRNPALCKLNLPNIELMKTLNKTLRFVRLVTLLSDKLNDLLASTAQTTLSFESCLHSISLTQFLRYLQTCSADTISAELVELCLITTQLQLFFKLVDGQIKRTAAQIGNIRRQWNANDFHLYLPPAKPHFNRYALDPSEPGRLHSLLIRHQLIPPTTLPETVAYVFYGIGSSASWQPVVWLHTVAELSYFVDMFFGISDQRDKWRTAHLCFCDRKRHRFNYNSLRGKQYNYLSNRGSETLRIIDQIRRSLK